MTRPILSVDDGDDASLERRYLGLVKRYERDHAFWTATNHNLRKAYAKIDEAEAKLQRAQRLARLGTWELDVESDRVTASAELLDLLALTPKDFDGSRAALAAFVHPDDRVAFAHLMSQATRSAQSFDLVHRLLLPSGTLLHVRHHGTCFANAQGRAVQLFGAIQDVTDRMHDEQRLLLSAQVFDNVSEGLLVTDAALRIVEVNHAFEMLTGFSKAEMLGKRPEVLACSGGLAFDERGAAYAHAWAIAQEQGSWRGEVSVQRKSGMVFSANLSVSTVRERSGVVSNHIGLFADITTLKRSEQRLEYLASYDQVTGLPNRRCLIKRIESALEQCKADGRCVGLVFVDLDGFKLVNDSLGHEAGDQVLWAVGATLRRALREDDFVGRLGGDEFVVVLPSLRGRGAAEKIAADILNVVRHPIGIMQREHIVTASLGVAIGPSDGQDAESLLRSADTAMYRAKQQGKNAWHGSSGETGDKKKDAVGMAAALRRAVSHGELSLVFQPQIDIVQDRIVAVEALLRWTNPTFGSVPPSEFVPLAERTGLISAVSEWVIAEACRHTRSFIDQGLPIERVAVNVSPVDLRHQGMAARIEHELHACDLKPCAIELEITESMLADNDAQTRRTLEELEALGVRLSVDDFGTGYSSLCYLQRLPVDQIKMDRWFIQGIPAERSDTRLVPAIVALAKSLGLELIAEGVENEAQLEVVRSSGCRIVQGFLLGPPVAASELGSVFAARALRSFTAVAT